MHEQDITEDYLLDYDHPSFRLNKHVSTVDTQTYLQSRNQAILSENQLIKGYASRREIESAMQKLHGPSSQLTPAKAYEEYRDNGRRIIHKHASAVMNPDEQRSLG